RSHPGDGDQRALPSEETQAVELGVPTGVPSDGHSRNRPLVKDLRRLDVDLGSRGATRAGSSPAFRTIRAPLSARGSRWRPHAMAFQAPREAASASDLLWRKGESGMGAAVWRGSAQVVGMLFASTTVAQERPAQQVDWRSRAQVGLEVLYDWESADVSMS